MGLLSSYTAVQEYGATEPTGGGFTTIIFLLMIVLTIGGMWKMFTKAGHPGWAALVPFYNMYIMCQIAGRPGWWMVLFMVPLVSIVIALMVSVDIAKSFGKGVVFGLGLWLFGPIFYCILGYGDSEYEGPAVA